MGLKRIFEIIFSIKGNKEVTDVSQKLKERLIEDIKEVENKEAKVQATAVEAAKKTAEELVKIKEGTVTNLGVLAQAEVKSISSSTDTILGNLESFAIEAATIMNRDMRVEGTQIIDPQLMQENVAEANASLDIYKAKLIEVKAGVEAFYNSQAKSYKDGSKELELSNAAKEKALANINQKMSDADKTQRDNLKKSSEAYKTFGEELQTQVKGFSDKVTNITNSMFSAATAIANFRAAEAQRKLDEMMEGYNKVVEAKKKSDAELSSLDEKAKNASGGRLIVLQQQRDAEMKANALLAAQEKDLAKEKEKLEKEKAKQEKRKKRLEMQQNIVSGISNVALGVTKALSLGPILGPIMAAVVSAAGAVQIGYMTKQMTKMAGGGLLKGKRHSDGGMQIEGTNIEVEGGEYVVNRTSTERNLGLIRYINSQRRELKPTDLNNYFTSSQRVAEPQFRRMFEEGGQLPVINNSVNVDNEHLIAAIQSMKIEPRVSVTDINTVQASMVSVNEWTGM